jgi:DNA-binding transcriptional regulator GbsR (MarR family)
MSIELNDKKKKLIEELGVIHEGAGMQPAAARIMSLLMVSDETELTFEELYETLNMSKSAASNALNFLLSTDRVEYITRSGERKRYFRVKLKSIRDGVGKFLEGMHNYNQVLKRVLDQRPVRTREFNNNLEAMIGFNDFIKEEMPGLIEKWNKKQQ